MRRTPGPAVNGTQADAASRIPRKPDNIASFYSTGIDVDRYQHDLELLKDSQCFCKKEYKKGGGQPVVTGNGLAIFIEWKGMTGCSHPATAPHYDCRKVDITGRDAKGYRQRQNKCAH